MRKISLILTLTRTHHGPFKVVETSRETRWIVLCTGLYSKKWNTWGGTEFPNCKAMCIFPLYSFSFKPAKSSTYLKGNNLIKNSGLKIKEIKCGNQILIKIKLVTVCI